MTNLLDGANLCPEETKMTEATKVCRRALMCAFFLLKRTDIFSSDDNVIEPDAVERVRVGNVILTCGVLGHVMQEPEKVELE